MKGMARSPTMAMTVPMLRCFDLFILSNRTSDLHVVGASRMAELALATAGRLRDNHVVQVLLANLFQFLTNPCRISSTVQDCVDAQKIVLHGVVHCKRKSFGKESMMIEYNWMHTCGDQQRFYVGIKGVKKVVSQSRLLKFVKIESFNQINFRFTQDSYLHNTDFLILSLAESQSEYCASLDSAIFMRD